MSDGSGQEERRAPTGEASPSSNATGPQGEWTGPYQASSIEGWPTVPGYEILGELGRGGMGVVYRARQVGLDRLVALKVVRAGAHATPEDLARFRREAEAVARLRHPNVVEIYEVGDQGGVPHFAMELCTGGSLAQQLAGGALALRRAAELVETLARAVQAAHEAGVVHRDLKPANVLLTADGIPKITDFGLAKKLDGTTELTATGAIVGTASYMAPEQASGDSKRVGPAADVYALGAILYELVTGRPPFQADTPFDTLLQVLSDAPAPPALLRPGVPADLEAVCLRCLEKKPAWRYASAAELADDLQRFRDGLPLAVRPRAGGAPLVRSRFRRLLNVVRLASLSLFLLAMPLFCGFGLLNERLNPKSPLVSWVVQVTMVASFVGIISYFVSAVEYFGTGKVGALVFTPDGQFLASAVGGTVRVWDVLGERLLSTLRPGQGRVRALSFAADGTRLMILTARGTVLVCDVASGGQRQRFRLPCRALAAAAFSPDGRSIAGVKGLLVATGRTLCLWEIDEKQAGVQQRAVLDAGSLLHGKVFFSADGRTVAVSSATGPRVWDLDAAGGPPRRRLLPSRACKASTLAPDGRTIAVAGDDKKTIAVRDTRLDREICTWTTRKSTPYALALSPDGRTLAGAFAGSTRLWDLADGRLLASLPARELVQAVVFSPDGRTLAVADAAGGVSWYDMAAVRRQARCREGQRTERTEGGTGEQPADAPARPAGEATGPSEPATSLPAAPAPETEATAAVPGYEILGELGRGGMGVVYRARQLGLDRVVALKMLREGAAAGPEDLARFRREAEAIARLGHPNIVRIYQVGEHHGLPFFSLEFCARGSLARRIAGRPQPVHQAAELVAVLARGAQAAHEAGVVHRDLKPGNVLLDAGGTPKLADFGLARKLDGASGLTQTGVVLGTPSYMAPEQASGAKDVGPAADVWALGATLYELLTGRPPFRAATAVDTLLQVVSEPPVPPSRLRGGIPAELEAICLRCLEKAPDRRPASAAALAADLERFLAGGARSAEQRPPSLSRWRLVCCLFTAAVLTLPPALVVVGCGRLGVPLPGWLGFIGFLSFMATLALGMAALGHAGHAMQEAAQRRRRMPRALAFRADAQALAVGCADGSVRLHDLVTEEVRRLAMARVAPDPPRPAVCALAFATRDDRHLLAVVDAAGVLKWWDPASGHEPAGARVAGVGRMERVIAAAFSPCGRWLAAATGAWSLRPWETPGQRWTWRLCEFLRVTPRHKVRLWDLSGGNELVVPANTAPFVWELAFASDASALIAATSAGTRRWALDRARGRAGECTLPTPETWGTVSPDGRMLARRNPDGTAGLWSATTGEELAVLAVEAPPTVKLLPAGTRQPPEGRSVVLLAFAPEGQTLALADDQGGVASCDVALMLRAGPSGDGKDGRGPGEGGSV
jgi:serine/threonine protein kinase/WD40 repeat protein